MKRPVVHRLLSFWLGLPGLLFLLWGWWVTMHEQVMFVRTFTAIDGKRPVVMNMEGVASSPGGLVLHVTLSEGRETVVIRKEKWRWVHRRFGVPRSAPWFPVPEHFCIGDRSYSGVQSWRVMIPMWMVVGSYLVLWSLLLAWRARVRRKGMAALSSVGD